jgi:hypothetical protein
MKYVASSTPGGQKNHRRQDCECPGVHNDTYLFLVVFTKCAIHCRRSTAIKRGPVSSDLGISSVPGFLLAPRSAYSQSLASYWPITHHKSDTGHLPEPALRRFKEGAGELGPPVTRARPHSCCVRTGGQAADPKQLGVITNSTVCISIIIVITNKVNKVMDASAYFLHQGWFGIRSLPTPFQLTRLLYALHSIFNST